jgi:hypothetical protein
MDFETCSVRSRFNCVGGNWPAIVSAWDGFVGCSLKDFAVTVQLYNKEFKLPPEERAHGVSTAFSRFMDSGGLRRAVDLIGQSPDLLQSHKGLSMLNELRRPKREEESPTTAAAAALASASPLVKSLVAEGPRLLLNVLLHTYYFIS